MMGLAAAIVVALLTVAASLTASFEAASQVSGSHLRTLEEEGFEGAKALATIREDRGAVRLSLRLVTGALKLTAFAVIALTGVTTWGSSGPVVNAVTGIAFVLLVADLVPHAVASRKPVRLALSSAPVLLAVARLTRPLTGSITRLEERLVNGGGPLTSERRELREIQEIGEEEGVLEESEQRLVERAFRLDELTAWDVMIPRVDIFAWKDGTLLSEIAESLGDVPYSRVPVYGESVDDVTGIVYVREAYERLVKGDRDAPLASIARDPFFVPGSLPLTKLLEDFQTRRIHMGIVADEFGGTDGLVTLEDILEELVGEIHDETDIAIEALVRLADDAVEVNASIDVREIDDLLGIELPKAEHRSLNGFILEELGQVPNEGDSFEREGVRFDILSATDTQVLRARVTRLGADNDGDPWR